jgi:hypothetical protein
LVFLLQVASSCLSEIGTLPQGLSSSIVELIISLLLAAMAPKAMKAMKAMKATKAPKKNQTFKHFKKTMKKLKAMKQTARQAPEQHERVKTWLKSWPTYHEGEYRSWKLVELKQQNGTVTEVWATSNSLPPLLQATVNGRCCQSFRGKAGCSGGREIRCAMAQRISLTPLRPALPRWL